MRGKKSFRRTIVLDYYHSIGIKTEGSSVMISAQAGTLDTCSGIPLCAKEAKKVIVALEKALLVAESYEE